MYQSTAMSSEPRLLAQTQFGRHITSVLEPKIFVRTVLTCLKISCVLGEEPNHWKRKYEKKRVWRLFTQFFESLDRAGQ